MIQKATLVTFAALWLLLSAGCMRHLTNDRSKALLEGVDIDQSLQVAAMYLGYKKGGWGASLSLWAIRDQPVSAAQAEKVSLLYFNHIAGFKKKFDVWHATWAVANIYRLGNDEVKAALAAAYDDATKRARALHKTADKMANGDTMYHGDAHAGGRSFARKHIVVPGNKKYVQSFEEYAAGNRRQRESSEVRTKD